MHQACISTSAYCSILDWIRHSCRITGFHGSGRLVSCLDGKVCKFASVVVCTSAWTKTNDLFHRTSHVRSQIAHEQTTMHVAVQDNEVIISSQQLSIGLSQLMRHTLYACGTHLRFLILTPSTPAVPNCCGSKGLVSYWSNPPFLIFDMRALWRSVLSARAPECQKLKMVG